MPARPENAPHCKSVQPTRIARRTFASAAPAVVRRDGTVEPSTPPDLTSADRDFAFRLAVAATSMSDVVSARAALELLKAGAR